MPTDPKRLDQLRADLFKQTGAFVDQLRAAPDPVDPALREQAFQRLLDLFRYASFDGRRRFLDEMTLPGAAQERRRVFEICRRAGRPDPECQAEAEKLPLVRDLLDAFPPANTVKDWWSAPVSQLIATYDPQNPPADDLAGWQTQPRRDLGNDRADLLLDIGDAYDTAGTPLDHAADTATDLPTPGPPTFPRLVLGLARDATALVGGAAYRIARR